MREVIIHNGSPEVGFEIVTEHKEKMKPYSIITENPTTDYICIDHYYTKSYEEWILKLRRGCAHSKYQRKYNEFFKFNKDMEYCRQENIAGQKYNSAES